MKIVIWGYTLTVFEPCKPICFRLTLPTDFISTPRLALNISCSKSRKTRSNTEFPTFYFNIFTTFTPSAWYALNIKKKRDCRWLWIKGAITERIETVWQKGPPDCKKWCIVWCEENETFVPFLFIMRWQLHLAVVSIISLAGKLSYPTRLGSFF